LCDTEAGPNRRGGGSGNTVGFEIMNLNNVNECRYIGGGDDNWGDAWRPETRNYMSVSNIRTCRNSFTRGQIGVMHTTILLHMGEGRGPFPGILGEPWYNKNNLILSSNVRNGETDRVYSPETIQTTTTAGGYTINSGGTINLRAQNRITFRNGFHARPGSNVNATVGNISNCDLVYRGGTNGVNRSVNTNTITDNIDYEMRDRVGAILLEGLDFVAQGGSSEEALARSSVEATGTEFKVLQFPGNVNDQLVLQMDQIEEESIEIFIYDLNGKMIINEHMEINPSTHSLDVNTGSFKPGTYIYKIQAGEYNKTGKFIKN